MHMIYTSNFTPHISFRFSNIICLKAFCYLPIFIRIVHFWDTFEINTAFSIFETKMALFTPVLLTPDLINAPNKITAELGALKTPQYLLKMDKRCSFRC